MIVLAKRLSLMSAVCFGLMMGGFGGAKADPVVNWRVQVLFPAGDRLYEHFKGCTDSMSAMSGDRIAFNVLPAGAAIGAGGTLDAIRTGVLDAHFSYAPIWAGTEPAFGVLGDLPGGHPSPESAYDFFYNGPGLDLMRRAYARFNGYVIGIVPSGVEALSSRTEIAGVDDLAGLQIRLPAGIAATVFERLGAAPVSLPLSEAFGALEKGVVDAADIGSLAYNNDLGVYRFANYAVAPSPHSKVIVDFTVNKSKWAALPNDLKAILEVGMQACGATIMGKIARADQDVIEAADDMGLTITTWSQEDLDRFRDVAFEVWDEWAERSELAADAVEAQRAFMEERGIINR